MKDLFVVVSADALLSFDNIVAICDSKQELESLSEGLGKDSFYEIYRFIKYSKGEPFAFPPLFSGYIKNKEVQLHNVF